MADINSIATSSSAVSSPVDKLSKSVTGGGNLIQDDIGNSSIPNSATLSATKQLSQSSLNDPITLPNGSVLLPPISFQMERPNIDQERPPIDWPQPIFQRNGIPRTKSFISMTTTISGMGNMSLDNNAVQQQSLLQAHQNANQASTIAAHPELDYLQLVLQASTRVYDVAVETPLQYAKNLSNKIGRDNRIYLKRDDMQPVCFSFKCRGSYNKISQLTPEERKRGVICMSAGNHAQGVALAAGKMKINATIVMPVIAPEIKILNVRRLGATVILHGNDLEEAKKECLRLAKENGYVFIPPYDDPYIIAGQGTCGMEILRQIGSGRRVDAIFVPVGGGGLLAGIAAFVKRVQPDVKIIGVNTVDSSGMTQSLQKGERLSLDKVGLFSDGTAVRAIGEETYRICSNLVDDMVLVTVDEICAAIKDVFDDSRSILEPAGALGVAGVKKYLNERGAHIKGGIFVAVTSGANMNFDRLRFVCERSRIGEGKECLLSCKVDERPGSFMELYSQIHPRAVTEVSYRYSDPSEAHVYIAFEVTKGKREMEQVLTKINSSPSITAVDITDNDMAKSHLRFLAGGRAPKSGLINEKLYRFTFPERPGSLKSFLDYLQKASNPPEKKPWNLTLLHYRNTGGDTAKVLVGIDIPTEAETDGQLQSFLQQIGHSYVEETTNPVYQHFLR